MHKFVVAKILKLETIFVLIMIIMCIVKEGFITKVHTQWYKWMLSAKRPIGWCWHTRYMMQRKRIHKGTKDMWFYSDPMPHLNDFVITQLRKHNCLHICWQDNYVYKIVRPILSRWGFHLHLNLLSEVLCTAD